MQSRDCQGVPIWRQIGCLFNSFFELSSKKTSEFSQRIYDAEIHVMTISIIPYLGIVGDII